MKLKVNDRVSERSMMIIEEEFQKLGIHQMIVKLGLFESVRAYSGANN
jgi:hypothetical protein